MSTRTTRMLQVLMLALLAGACATKKDVRVLSTEMNAMRRHQDSVLVNMQRQNRMLLDSIRAAMQISLNTGGTTASRLREFDQTVDRLTQLMGQVTNSLSRIEQRLSGLEQRLTTLEQRPSQMQRPQGPSAEQLLTTGMQRLSEQSYATARLAFETLIQQYPEDERAPWAQHQIAETYVREGSFTEAYAAFEAVAQRWSTSPRAAGAILQAGIVAQDQGDRTRARRYYDRVIRDYKDSEEARTATRRLAQVR